MRTVVIFLSLALVTLLIASGLRDRQDFLHTYAGHPPSWYLERKEVLVEELDHNLKHFESIDSFANHHLETPVTAHRLARGELTGLSNCPVYRLKDEAGNTLAYAKAYDLDGYKFDRFFQALAGIDLIQKLELEHNRPIELLAAAYVDHYAVMLMSVAPGRSLHEYMVHAAEATGEERSALVIALATPYELLGRTLGELHAAGTHPLEHAPAYKNHGDKTRARLPHALEIGGHNSTSLLETFDRMGHRQEATPGPIAYNHGQPIPCNIFYEEGDDHISLIDIDFFGYSISPHGQPQGLAALDYIKAREIGWIDGRLTGLNEEELNFLTEAFDRGYEAYATPPPAESCDYWRLISISNRFIRRTLSPDPHTHEGPQVLPYLLDRLDEIVFTDHLPFARVEIPETPLGRSGNPIFRAYDEEGNLVAYLKAYHNPENQERLLRSMEIVEIEPLLVGAISDYAYIALEPYPGKTIQQWLREGNLEVASRAVVAAGKLLQELHLRPVTPGVEMGSFYLEREERLRRDLPEALATLQLTSEPFFEALSLARAQADLEPGPLTLVHGDAQPSNIIYDPDTDQAHFIDLDLLCYSLNEEGKAVGPAAYDFELFSHSLYGIGLLNGYPEEDLAELNRLFQSSYTLELPEEANEYWDLLMWGSGIVFAHQNEYDDGQIFKWLAQAEKTIDRILDFHPSETYNFSDLELAQAE